MTDEMNLSLADLAEVSMDDIEEVSYEALPLGTYGFEIGECSGEDGLESKKGDSMIKIEIPCKIIDVKTVIDPKVDRESLIDTTHNERIFIVAPSAAKDLGRLKKFVNDVGGQTAGLTPLQMIEALEGLTFTASVKHRPDKNDKSIKYTQLVFPKRPKVAAAQAV